MVVEADKVHHCNNAIFELVDDSNEACGFWLNRIVHGFDDGQSVLTSSARVHAAIHFVGESRDALKLGGFDAF